MGWEVEGAAVGDEADLAEGHAGENGATVGEGLVLTMASGLTSHHVQSLPLLISFMASCCAKQKTLRAIGSGNRPMDSLKGALKTPPGM